MLAAVATLAVVGGALAFKARENSIDRNCYKQETSAGTCTTTAHINSTAVAGTGVRYTSQLIFLIANH